MPHFIAESAIFQEAQVVKSSPGKAIFRMIMQSADEINQNRRMYPHQVLDEGMAACKPRIERKADYEWRGKHLVGELETASTPNGAIMAGLLKDGSGVGLSMRGLATIKRQDSFNEVEGPLTVVAFDSVSLPSHKSAVVDFSEMKFESQRFLTENIRESDSGVICTPDGQCYLANYFDRLVESKVVEFFDRWV